MLNSIWGRYCLQTNKTKYKLINSKEEFFNFFLNDQFVVQDVHFLNENIAQLFYTDNESLHVGGRETNVVLGSFVTAYGRIKLYENIFKLDSAVLYFDTDSIIFKVKDGDYEPELGDYLGEFTNKVSPNDGGYIKSFVSTGPKCYAYETANGKTCCKIKGFTLNYIASQKINFSTMKTLELNQDKHTLIGVEQNVFIRNKKDWSIKTF